MLQHAFFMAISTGVRLFTGVVLFVLLARKLGPADFGQFAYWVTVTSLLSLVVDYGFTPKILREVGKEPASARKALGEALVTKLGFSICLFFLLAAVPFIFKLESRDVVLMFSLMAAAIGFSFGDFICAPFRALDSYGEETKIVVFTSVVHFLLVYGAAVLDLGLETLAIFFAVSRIIYAVTSFISSYKVLGKPVWPKNRLACFFKEAKDGLYYALDMGMANLYLQIDTVLINLYLGSHAVGVYQAGAKLVQGFYTLVQIAINVYLPKLARAELNNQVFETTLKRMSIQLLVIGLVGYLSFSVGAPYFQENFYGREYFGLRELFPLFGLLILTRFYSVPLGTAVVALGFQRYRFNITLLNTVLFVGLSPVVIPEYGLKGVVLILIGLAFVSLFAFYYKLSSRGYSTKYCNVIVVSLTALVLVHLLGLEVAFVNSVLAAF